MFALCGHGSFFASMLGENAFAGGSEDMKTFCGLRVLKCNASILTYSVPNIGVSS